MQERGGAEKQFLKLIILSNYKNQPKKASNTIEFIAFIKPRPRGSTTRVPKVQPLAIDDKF